MEFLYLPAAVLLPLAYIVRRRVGRNMAAKESGFVCLILVAVMTYFYGGMFVAAWEDVGEAPRLIDIVAFGSPLFVASFPWAIRDLWELFREPLPDEEPADL